MVPAGIKLRKQSRCLALTYGADTFELSYEFLRVFSPSAEVRGHGVGNEVLQYGKQDVGIVRIEPAGNYALKLIFDDGHDSGLYDWKYLRHLCLNHDSLWQEYLQKLEAAGKTRASATINFRSV